MEFNVIDSKAIAREQNALKRKYDKFLEAANELPMRKENRQDLEEVLSESFKNQVRDIIERAMGSDVQDAEFEEGEETTLGIAHYAGNSEPEPPDAEQLRKTADWLMSEGTTEAADTDPDDLKGVNI